MEVNDLDTRGFCLYAKPSLWEGMARLLDVMGTMNEYNYSDSEIEADYKALLSDWEAVGHDIETAIEHFDKEYQNGNLSNPVE